MVCERSMGSGGVVRVFPIAFVFLGFNILRCFISLVIFIYIKIYIHKFTD